MMVMTTRLWCSTLFLAAIVGCAGEEAPPQTELPQTPTSEIKPSPPKAEMTPKTDEAPKPEPKADEAPKADETPKAEPKADEAPKVEGPKAEAKTSKLTNDEIAEIKKLPAAEQDLALKQAVCPVSDEHLGEMGMPVKVTAEGKTFFLCCKSCEKEVKADPKAVVAKLAK
jgi:outer membrane biosynthesis protein TonB